MLKVHDVPPHIGWYIAGFADGEGSFNVSFRPRGDYEMPWKVSLCFNVSQRDRVILALLKKHLACGTMRQRSDGNRAGCARATGSSGERGWSFTISSTPATFAAEANAVRSISA